jgi:hypothetical protein
MYISSAQKRIMTAIIVSMTVVSGALLIKGAGNGVSQNSTGSDANAIVVSAAPERSAITITDSNNDGVPDWQESLITTTPIDIEEKDSNYLTPDTLTSQFALEFFEQIVRSENSGVFGQSPEELVAASSDALVAQAVDAPITRKDITIGNDTSEGALTTYAKNAIAIVETYSEQNPRNEMEIIQDALRTQNPAVLTELDAKVIAYTKFLEETQRLTVPSSVATEHLNLLNSYQAIRNDIVAMRNAFTDPMLALLRLKRYQDDALGLTRSIDQLSIVLIQQGVQITGGPTMFNSVSN